MNLVDITWQIQDNACRFLNGTGVEAWGIFEDFFSSVLHLAYMSILKPKDH